MTEVAFDRSGAKARLVVIKGLWPMWEYPLFEGQTIIGRAEEQPVEIDLAPHEAEDRIFSSLQHACIDWDGHRFTIEDLGSANGTYVNKMGLQPRKRGPLKEGDIIQIGEVELKLLGNAPHETGRFSSTSPSGARLLVIRGLQPNREYFISEGTNIIGRGDQKAVEIDLLEQEVDYRVWVSRQHARVTRHHDSFLVEDLYTRNATYVNRRRVLPGVKHALQEGDMIQIGEVQLKLVTH